jgi:hypothetical protein
MFQQLFILTNQLQIANLSYVTDFSYVVIEDGLAWYLLG